MERFELMEEEINIKLRAVKDKLFAILDRVGKWPGHLKIFWNDFLFSKVLRLFE